MPMPRKKEPEKYCSHCGKRLERRRFANGDLESLTHFKRRKYCDQICAAKDSTGKETTNSPSWYVSHHRARRKKQPEKCEKCGSTKNVDVHHRDENWQNNSPENLIALCRSCHLKEHRPKMLCKLCGKPQKGLGLCNKHYIRFKKYGDPLYTKYRVAESES
ncbi:HNH endonuclease signature motif containing protein [Cohnella massiliensis]|uniref:HNH endonuclease signature motif containing protein n=1 Tax=Cohnella massiliensis TaxID=1816691 RepID=UPI003CCBFB99